MIRPPILRPVHHQHSKRSHQPQREDPSDRAEPLRARQPHLTTSSAMRPAHFATTAHTAIAADNSPMKTGTIIW